MTNLEFKQRSESLFLRANPAAKITGWVEQPRRVQYPTGLRGIRGKFHAIGTGYRPRVMLADWDAETGFAVR